MVGHHQLWPLYVQPQTSGGVVRARLREEGQASGRSREAAICRGFTPALKFPSYNGNP